MERDEGTIRRHARGSIACTYVVKLPSAIIERSALSYDHERLDGRAGIDLVRRTRGYPPESLRTPADHLREMTERGWIGDGFVLCQTQRNLVQNPRSPAFRADTGLCQRRGECAELSARPYFGIAHTTTPTGVGSFAPLAVDLRAPFPRDVAFWGAGIPVLWDREVASLETLLPEVGDFCHLFRLRVSAARGRDPEDVRRFERLSVVFHEHRHAPAARAAAALADAARGLEREHDYLHQAIGVGPDCLVFVVAHGSLEHIGHIAQRAGATHACVMDNGGSCQLSLRRPGGDLRPLVESHYFREPTIALAAFEIATDRPDLVPFDGLLGALHV